MNMDTVASQMTTKMGGPLNCNKKEGASAQRKEFESWSRKSLLWGLAYILINKLYGSGEDL